MRRHEIGLHGRDVHPVLPEVVEGLGWHAGVEAMRAGRRRGAGAARAHIRRAADVFEPAPPSGRAAGVRAGPRAGACRIMFGYPGAPPAYSVSWYAGALSVPLNTPVPDLLCFFPSVFDDALARRRAIRRPLRPVAGARRALPGREPAAAGGVRVPPRAAVLLAARSNSGSTATARTTARQACRPASNAALAPGGRTRAGPTSAPSSATCAIRPGSSRSPPAKWSRAMASRPASSSRDTAGVRRDSERRAAPDPDRRNAERRGCGARLRASARAPSRRWTPPGTCAAPRRARTD